MEVVKETKDGKYKLCKEVMEDDDGNDINLLFLQKRKRIMGKITDENGKIYHNAEVPVEFWFGEDDKDDIKELLA